MGRNRRPTSPANPFYAYSAEEIARECGVSIGTAEHYKAGRRKPPTPILRLFSQFRDGKILGPGWTGFRVVGDTMFCPNSRPITPSQIELAELAWQALAELNREKYEELRELAMDTKRRTSA